MKTDYSAYLTPERLAIEDHWWATHGIHAQFAESVLRSVVTIKRPRILEVGCGGGWLPYHLGDANYLGIDANQGCIDLCTTRHPKRRFLLTDIRTFVPDSEFDVVCALAVLKHFPLHEWSGIVRLMLGWAPRAVFTMPIAGDDFDDGVEFYHTFVSIATLIAAVLSGGHTVVERRYFPGNEVEPIVTTIARSHLKRDSFTVRIG